jgi:rubrerythrin
MRYQCNVCGKIYYSHHDAALCRPDVNEIPDAKVYTMPDNELPAAEACHCFGYTTDTGGRCPVCGKQRTQFQEHTTGTKP